MVEAITLSLKHFLEFRYIALLINTFNWVQIACCCRSTLISISVGLRVRVASLSQIEFDLFDFLFQSGVVLALYLWAGGLATHWLQLVVGLVHFAFWRHFAIIVFNLTLRIILLSEPHWSLGKTWIHVQSTIFVHFILCVQSIVEFVLALVVIRIVVHLDLEHIPLSAGTTLLVCRLVGFIILCLSLRRDWFRIKVTKSSNWLIIHYFSTVEYLMTLVSCITVTQRGQTNIFIHILFFNRNILYTVHRHQMLNTPLDCTWFLALLNFFQQIRIYRFGHMVLIGKHVRVFNRAGVVSVEDVVWLHLVTVLTG